MLGNRPNRGVVFILATSWGPKRRGQTSPGGRPESLAGAQNVGHPFPKATGSLG